MNPPTRCLECDAELTSAETQGLCARCILKMGLASQLGGPSSIPSAPANSSPPPLMPFDFGGYRIQRLLGKGGMGAVYEAEELASGRRVALKALGHSLDSPETRKRFLREGRIAASINHPNTVYVYGTEEVEGTPVITMELVAGGTLQERVKDGGPMPVAEAVDVILQIVAGLEAAHAVGILHRDIKPSNCFLDPSGAVKVGDFGLSISTLARSDSLLTLAGSVLGTPEFSSPEQLRGEELTVCSDIYSVGVTLYFLLTGRTPFQAENLVQLLATVLDKPAPSPRTLRPEIPDRLARVVMRCLEKQPGDRFKSYDELRGALLPFNSTAPTPATLGRRFLGGAIDHWTASSLHTVLAMAIVGDPLAMTDPEVWRSPQWFWINAGLFLLQVAYYAVPEGLWGASLGKTVVGLRVAGLDRSAPGIPRALLRALIYVGPTAALMLFRGTGEVPMDTAGAVMGTAIYVYLALLFMTARRHNGFAAIHDLVTRTRVIQKSAYEPGGATAQTEEPVAAVDALPQIGPYHALSTLTANGSGELVLGYDTKLLRRVWIRKAPADAAPVTAALRNAARRGRLRWLQGRRNGDAWDAYEAVPGTAFVNLLRIPQPWKRVRCWLLDMAAEVDAASRDGSLPAQFSLGHLWITADSRAKLLDFPAPGADQPAEPIAGSEPHVFLNQIAISALEGRVVSAEEARTCEARVPVPLPARSVLRELREAPDVGAIAARLHPLTEQVPAIMRRRRLGLIAGCVIPALIMGGTSLVGIMLSTSWHRQNPDVMLLRSALTIHERMQQGKFPDGVDPGIGVEPAEIFIAGRFGRVVNDPRVWSSPFASSLFSAKQRASAARIVARHPEPAPEEMARARAALGPALNKDGELKRASRVRKPEKQNVNVVAKWPFALAGFIWAAFLSLAAALLFRGGLLMRALGIAVVRGDGSDASRGLIFWRACVAWSWMPLGSFAVFLLSPLIGATATVVTIVSLIVAVGVWSAALPDRSLPDRISGTWLVPR